MAAPSGYKLERRWSLTHFLIGVFGATAILGVMAKIFNFEAEVFGYLVTWKPVVLVGFVGEALVFILMGMMREFQYVPVEDAPPGSDEQSSAFIGSHDGDVAVDFEGADEELTREAERLAEEIRDVRAALSEQRRMFEELAGLRNSLKQANESLSKQTEALTANMETLESLYDAQIPMAQDVEAIQKDLTDASEDLSTEIMETRKAMRALRSQFTQAARRFEQFNASPATTDTTPTPNE